MTIPADEVFTDLTLTIHREKMLAGRRAEAAEERAETAEERAAIAEERADELERLLDEAKVRETACVERARAKEPVPERAATDERAEGMNNAHQKVEPANDAV